MEDKFELAAEVIKNAANFGVKKVDDDTLLKLYGWYKVVTVGKNETSKPGMLDFKGKAQGRGAYVCHNQDCLKKAIKSKALERSLEGSIPDEIYLQLKEQMEVGDA